MGSCDVGDGSTVSNGASLREARVGSWFNPGGLVVELARSLPAFDGIVAVATKGAAALGALPAKGAPSAGRILRGVEAGGLAPLGTAAVFRAIFCTAGAGFTEAFVLTRFFTRTYRFPANINCR